MRFREGLHRCWYDMIIARDLYRDWSKSCGVPMHKDVILRFVEALVVMICPICPHWSEHLWGLLGRPGTVCDAPWPRSSVCDKLLRKQLNFFRETLKNARMASLKSKASGSKGASVYLASTYDENKVEVLKFLANLCDEQGCFPDDLLKRMKEFVESKPELKKGTKVLMQFGAFMRDEAKERGPDALAIEQAFDQKAILEVG